MMNTGSPKNFFTSLQWRILLVMAGMNFINYVDRQVIFPLFHVIGNEFDISDFELGMLGSAFMLVHSMSMLPFGILADRISRTRIVGYAAAFWSSATVLTGLAQSYRFLLGIRALLGLGEAAYAPAAASLISDVFPVEERARAQSLFALGMFAGGTVGMILGGLLGEWVGWRAAFFLVGLPGLFLSWVCFRTPDPGVNIREFKYEVFPSLRILLGLRPYLLVVLAGTLVTFASGSLITWGTEFAIRYYSFTLRRAAVMLGLGVLIGGILGLLTGGWVADWAKRRWPWGRAFTVGVAICLAAPCLLLALYAPDGRVLMVALFLSAFFLAVYHGPVTAIIHDLTPHSIHGFAFAAYVTIAHLLGDVFAPALIGYLSDLYELRIALLLAVLAVLASGPVFLLAGRRMNRNPVQAVPTLST